MWLTSVNESSLLMSACATAPRMPITIVSAATTMSAVESWSVGNMTVSVRRIA